MSQQTRAHAELWLGFDNLAAPFALISAVLVYLPAWDRRIAQSCGSVPSGVQAVVLLSDGRVLPSRRSLADVHARWQEWQRRQPGAAAQPDAGAAPTSGEQP